MGPCNSQVKLQRGEESVSSGGMGGTLCVKESVKPSDKQHKNPQLHLSRRSTVSGLEYTALAQAVKEEPTYT